MGPVVRPLLENLLLDIKADAETVARLRQVLGKFPAEADFAAASAAARLIARDQPPGSLPVLLDFISYATSEPVRQEVQRAINKVALAEKKPSPLLIAALKDTVPARRAAAGEAMLRVGGGSAKEAIAPLLTDAHPLVRCQIGMALVETHDQSGVPLLIKALIDSPPERAQHVLELLDRVTAEDAPTEYYRGKQSAGVCCAAWTGWYEKHQAKLDLAKQLTKSELGFTIITTSALKPNTKNKVLEIGPGPANEPRWEFDGPRYPLDVHIIGANRLLMAEYFDRRVTERDFKGNILKQFHANLPVACQRLPNGDTFIVTRQLLSIVDPDGKEVFTWSPQLPSITAAKRLRNGQIAVVTTGGRCQLLDIKGRELKSFQMGGAVYTLGGNIDVLPNGRILTPLNNLNRVVEFDWAGNKHWEAIVSRPVSATRLSNGHTLVTCSLDYRVIELDAQGKEVWSYHTEGRPFRARRR